MSVELETSTNVVTDNSNDVESRSNLEKQFDSTTVSRLFEPSNDSHFSRNFADDRLDNSDSDLEAQLLSKPGFSASRRNNAKRQVQFSEKSKKVIEDANQLLQSIEERNQFKPSRSRYSNENNESINYALPRLHDYTQESTSLYQTQPLNFPRIDFNDMLEEELADRKPAWKQLQENIKDSYRKPKRVAERNREFNETQELFLSQQRRRVRRSESPFSYLDSESFIPRAPSWFASGAMQPRGLNLSGSGPYAAPAVSRSQGLETQKRAPSRYDRLVDDIEERLLKTTILPKCLKTITKKEFSRAPYPSSGSATESLVIDDEVNFQLPRPFYSRPDRSDPDYFDFDLQHSIDLFRKPEGKYIPRGPQPWENKLLNEAMAKGDAPLSGYMFTKGAPPSEVNAKTSLPLTDWRSTNTSYLSAALRTPSFWEHRFASIGSQVRDSNPISMDSILRNKPVPNKFTEYRDPDFADYEDPKATD